MWAELERLICRPSLSTMPQTEAEIAEAGYIQDKIKDAAFNREAALPWRTPAEGDRSFNCF